MDSSGATSAQPENSSEDSNWSNLINKIGRQPFCSEFEKNLSELFISEGDFKIDIVENVPLTNTEKRQSVHAVGPLERSTMVHSISSLDSLISSLRQKLPDRSYRVFILYRFNSWSRIDITAEMFRALYKFIQITPHFLKIVMGLGRKFSSWDEDFMSCYSRFSVPSSQMLSTPHVADLCYNIRHFERHGRDINDPWSCRQSAIYQKFDLDSESSDWIVIHPPVHFAPGFKFSGTDDLDHPMYLHLHYLAVGVFGWREYLNCSSRRLKKLNEVIAICKPYGDFGLDFSSRQQIHAVRHKLYHARSILANTSNTLATISMHEKTLAEACHIPMDIHDGFQRELQNVSTELNNHKQTTRKLLSFATDIGLMYDDILKFHSQELLHNNGLKLAQIAQDDSHETKTMALLADKTYHDSRTTRIATVIAMFYLPANLVLSFFSTTLVWFDGDDTGKGSDEAGFSLRVHQETWLAVLITAVFVAVTKMASWWWDRKERKRGLNQV
ncbi:hypothetical protein F4811DRAFT_122101 [Daldinia bambusicola]|nr:hypothetical protein F4811DRAFT_122101 [Daldinia bambusicola]